MSKLATHRRGRLRDGFTLAIAITAGMAACNTANAQSRCAQLASWAACLEVRASSVTGALIDFADGSQVELAPSGGFVDLPPSIVAGITVQDGYKHGSYAGYGLLSGNGPQINVDYRVASAGRLDNQAYGYAGMQQVTSAYLAGGWAAPTLAQTSRIGTGFGVNRAYIEIDGAITAPFDLPAGNAINPASSGTVTQHVLGSAQSIWRDTLTFASTERVHFDIQIDGSSSGPGSWWFYDLTAVDGNGLSQNIISDFAQPGNPGPVGDRLRGFLDVQAGLSYALTGGLYAYVSEATGVTDLEHSARLTAIEVSAGNAVGFASGSADWQGVVSSVPENQTAGLMLGGLGLLGALLRRRPGVKPDALPAPLPA